MNLERLINSQTGKIGVSIILGLGLATLFRKACDDETCLSFNGPVITDLEDKIYNMETNVINIPSILILVVQPRKLLM